MKAKSSSLYFRIGCIAGARFCGITRWTISGIYKYFAVDDDVVTTASRGTGLRGSDDSTIEHVRDQSKHPDAFSHAMSSVP